MPPQGGPYGPYGGGPPQNPYGDPGWDQQYRQPPQDPYGGGMQQGGMQGDPYYQDRGQQSMMADAGGPARLILESGAGKLEYPLDKQIVTIGRSRMNDISLEDIKISRNHARVVRGEQGFFVEDLKSRNGTRVDDVAIHYTAELRDGSLVKIGDATFRFTQPQGRQQQMGGQNPYGGGQGQPQYGGGMQQGPYGGGPPPNQYGGGGMQQGPYGGGPPPNQYGGGPGYPPPAGGMGGQVGGPVPEVYVSSWQPVQCPGCQAQKSMRQIVYGPAAQSPNAQAAAQRGEIVIGPGAGGPGAPNAECRACGTRVRIVSTGG